MLRRNFLKYIGLGSLAPLVTLQFGGGQPPKQEQRTLSNDQINRIQLAMQMHDKGLISASTLTAMLDIDYDKEVELMRQEQKRIA